MPAKGKLPAALDIFPSHLVQFRLGSVYSQSTVNIGAQSYPIASFIRDLNPDPENPYNGRSIVAAAAQTIDLEEQMKSVNQMLMRNGARPSLVFQTNVPLNDDSYERWKKQFVDDYTGVDNAGKPLLIEGGSVQANMLSPKDLDYLSSRKFSRDEILAMFRVSPGMIGSVENVNRSNLEAGFYINAVMNVVPRIRQFVRQLNATFIKVYDPTLELGFVNPVPEDEEAKLKAATAGVDKWWTKDEVRDMYGDKPFPYNMGEQIIVTGHAAYPLKDVISGASRPTFITPAASAEPDTPTQVVIIHTGRSSSSAPTTFQDSMTTLASIQALLVASFATLQQGR